MIITVQGWRDEDDTERTTLSAETAASEGTTNWDGDETPASNDTVDFKSNVVATPERLQHERLVFENEQSAWQANLQRVRADTANISAQTFVQEPDAAGSTRGHTVYASENDVPYKHVKILGRGTFGWVDEVEGPNKIKGIPDTWGGFNEVFARKSIPLSRKKLTDNSASIRNEVDIISKLRHQHLVQLICTYQCNRNFAILMQPVANGDLKEYLEETDSLSSPADKRARILRMVSWSGCLIRVVQFLHEQRIRHKDIKPANILVRGSTRGSQVLLTDFGIAKDLQDDTSTVTTGNPGFHTALYAAPEVHNGEPRGRAADIFSLGCVLLEMATVMLGVSLESFHKFVETDGVRAYAKNEQKILQWLLFFLAKWKQQWTWYKKKLQCPRPVVSPLFDFATSICDLTFLMLDPDSRTRITADQLTDLVALGVLPYQEIMIVSCDTCRLTWRDQAGPLRLHSYFKEADEFHVPDVPARALETETPPSWAAAKRMWLKYHLHW